MKSLSVHFEGVVKKGDKNDNTVLTHIANTVSFSSSSQQQRHHSSVTSSSSQKERCASFLCKNITVL